MDTSAKEKSKQMEKSENFNVNSDDYDPRVSFLYKAMLNRDPRKRRVKPVQRSQVQVSFDGLDDSDEDSDFDISKHSKDLGENANSAGDDDSVDSGDKLGDDVEIEEEDESDGDDEDQEDEEEDTDEDDDEDDDEEEDDGSEHDDMEEGYDEHCEEETSSKATMKSPEIKGLGQAWSMIDSDDDDEDYVPRKKKKKSGKSVSVKSDSKPKTSQKKDKSEENSKPQAKEDLGSPADGAPKGRIKVIVCCVCLSDRSVDEDEIVECDHCGISVHEGCYGISESHSTASTESSASTEPWFCDACKASAKPVCELCPNSGGIFKETDNGKWVHIVCALYTPGVAFGDVDKLSLVTLFEMSYSKWGARECSLCEDPRFSQTGVCISCDAGMCKAYFHVTCAQKEGLLAEAAPEEVMDIADPFFAYCKLHADKITSKMKRRNWLAIQSHVKTHRPGLIGDEQERLRFDRKLCRHQEKYSVTKLKRPPSWVPTQKMVRHLHTSPSAVRGFLRKAELMGIITQVHSVPDEKQEVRKAAVGQPAFTAEFINYFMERNVKVENLKNTLTELLSQNSKLQAQEKVVRKHYDQLNASVEELKQEGNSLRREGESLCGMLQDIFGRPIPHVPEVFKSRKRTKSPDRKEPSRSPTILINQCGICDSTTEQHLLAKCDSCKKHYHLGCLEPPLTRMPKKTKLFGWQCSYCVIPSTDDSARSVPDVDQPRRLRETIKEPDKFFHLSHIQDSLKSQEQRSLLRKRKRRQRDNARAKRLARNAAKTSKSPENVSPEKPKAGSNKSVKTRAVNSSQSTSTFITAVGETISDVPIICVVCNKGGLVSDTVRCDECMLSYHLLCLDPPMKKSPKVRGYMWHCEACDMMDSSNDDITVTQKRPGSSRISRKDDVPVDLTAISDTSS